jgi:predicted nucleic acid-binding protein
VVQNQQTQAASCCSDDEENVFEATGEHHKETTKLLDRFRGSKLTYVDASSLALIERHKIACVWSTDYHLGLTSSEVLPRL